MESSRHLDPFLYKAHGLINLLLEVHSLRSKPIDQGGSIYELTMPIPIPHFQHTAGKAVSDPQMGPGMADPQIESFGELQFMHQLFAKHAS